MSTQVLPLFSALLATLTSAHHWGSAAGALFSWFFDARVELGRELAAGRLIAEIAEELVTAAEIAPDAPEDARDEDEVTRALWSLGLPLWEEAARVAGREAALQGPGADTWPAQSPVPLEEALAAVGQTSTWGMSQSTRQDAARAFVEAYNAQRAEGPDMGTIARQEGVAWGREIWAAFQGREEADAWIATAEEEDPWWTGMAFDSVRDRLPESVWEKHGDDLRETCAEAAADEVRRLASADELGTSDGEEGAEALVEDYAREHQGTWDRDELIKLLRDCARPADRHDWGTSSSEAWVCSGEAAVGEAAEELPEGDDQAEDPARTIYLSAYEAAARARCAELADEQTAEGEEGEEGEEEGWIKEDTSWEENGIGYYGEDDPRWVKMPLAELDPECALAREVREHHCRVGAWYTLEGQASGTHRAVLAYDEDGCDYWLVDEGAGHLGDWQTPPSWADENC